MATSAQPSRARTQRKGLNGTVRHTPKPPAGDEPVLIPPADAPVLPPSPLLNRRG